MKTLRRIINGALRSARAQSQMTQSDLDVLTDIAVVAEEINRRAVAPPRADISAARLKQAIRELPERDRAMMLARRAGKTYKQIAQESGLSEFMVLRSLSRTYAELRMRASS